MDSLQIINDMDNNSVAQTLNKISAFQAVVQKTLKPKHDFDTIPGTNKPTLLKPGAEKINMLFGTSPEYSFDSKIEDFDKEFFSYTMKCTLIRNGQPVAQGVGACNSKEGKYRYRNVKEADVPKHLDKDTLQTTTNKYGKTMYRIDNDDSCSIANTVLKMAKKRAYVDATLQIGALSEIFTQDIEDMKEYLQAEHTNNMTVEEAASMVMNFGKHKGTKLGDIYKNDLDWVNWFIKQDNADPILSKAFGMLIDAANKTKKKKEEVDYPEVFKGEA